MKSNLVEPIGTPCLADQLRLIEEAAAALKLQHCEIIRIGSALYAKQLLESILGN